MTIVTAEKRAQPSIKLLDFEAVCKIYVDVEVLLDGQKPFPRCYELTRCIMTLHEMRIPFQVAHERGAHYDFRMYQNREVLVICRFPTMDCNAPTVIGF